MKNIVKEILILLFHLVPIDKNKILFVNFAGNGYGDNPKYIANELMLHKDLKLYWIVKDKLLYVPSNIKKIKMGTLRSVFCFCTAHVIVTNVQNTITFKKRKKQFIVQTCHGSYTPKRIEFDAADKLSRDYLEMSEFSTSQTNIFLSNSAFQTEEFRHSFRYNGEVLEVGYPRNDIFFKDNSKLKIALRKKLKLGDRMVIFYTPTFRDDSSTNGYNIDINRVLSAFNEKFKRECVIMVRMHPNVKDYKTLFNFNSDVIDVTQYPDGQELLAISDILITDYSSNMFDFLLFNNNIYIYASDIERYNKVRGLKDFMFKLPFNICRNNDELIKEIKNRDKTKHTKRVSAFLEEYKVYDRGTASADVANRIVYEIKKS